MLVSISAGLYVSVMCASRHLATQQSVHGCCSPTPRSASWSIICFTRTQIPTCNLNSTATTHASSQPQSDHKPSLLASEPGTQHPVTHCQPITRVLKTPDSFFYHPTGRSAYKIEGEQTPATTQREPALYDVAAEMTPTLFNCTELHQFSCRNKPSSVSHSTSTLTYTPGLPITAERRQQRQLRRRPSALTMLQLHWWARKRRVPCQSAEAPGSHTLCTQHPHTPRARTMWSPR